MTCSLAIGFIRRLSLRVTQRDMERAALGVRDQMRTEQIRRRTKVTDIAQVAKLRLQWALHISQNRCTLGTKVQEWRPRTGKHSIGTTSMSCIDNLTPGPKRHQTVVFGTPYKIPMSSSGRPLVGMIMVELTPLCIT
ncbi:jg7403 [Pararge aegeria aegeria]|uniref:Jg7403 protein n=1 Tax=Pararge aegeria aegeria TaxID=348720 RepID=A0A8S4RP94_9NEOP|nr:jg7403 [Pararge aegeria aegeria]